MDKNGYKYVISIGKLKCGRKPKAFNEFNPYALENLHLYFHKHNLNSKIIVNIIAQLQILQEVLRRLIIILKIN